jgi:hypothetical protein
VTISDLFATSVIADDELSNLHSNDTDGVRKKRISKFFRPQPIDFAYGRQEMFGKSLEKIWRSEGASLKSLIFYRQPKCPNLAAARLPRLSQIAGAAFPRRPTTGPMARELLRQSACPSVVVNA